MTKKLEEEPKPGLAARCGHFGTCGGCQIQDLPYDQQLQKKTDYLKTLLEPVGWKEPIEITPSPELWYYRNKMEFSFQDVFPSPPLGQDHVLLGLKRRKRWDKVMNLSECYLLSPEAPKLLEAVHAWAIKEDLEPYNLHRQQGFLRHLVVREAKNTKDRMVLLLTGNGKFPKESFVKAVESAYPATTILWGVNHKAADVAKSDRVDVLDGPGWIEDEVLGRRFRISPFSFFQTNTKGAEKLYLLIREWLAPLKAKNLLDLYCGSGGITLCVADLAEHVLGVETVGAAVSDARHNAAANKVANAEFMEATVESLLPAFAERKLEVDTIIVDPPRSGLHPTAVKALKDMAARWLIYVSCNPKALAEDIRRLADFYEPKKVQAVDLFPHTDHVETVVLLQARY